MKRLWIPAFAGMTTGPIFVAGSKLKARNGHVDERDGDQASGIRLKRVGSAVRMIATCAAGYNPRWNMRVW